VEPFREFRSWTRGAPGAERAVAAVCAVAVLALLGWLLVPGDDAEEASATATAAVGGGTPGATRPGAATVTTAPDAGTGVTPGASNGRTTGAGSAGGGGAVAATGAGGSGCVSPPGSARGMTASAVKVAIGLSSIAGPVAGQIFGIPPPDQQKASFEAIIGDINKNGGVACRKLVADYYEVNPTNQSEMHQQCIDIADSGAYAIIDTGPYASITSDPLACFADHKVPYFGAYFIPEYLRQDKYPYLFSFYTYANIYRDTVFALKDRGFFDAGNGFKKLGVLYRTCNQREVDVFFDSLKRAGVTGYETYDVGCPAALASPADIAQAVLKFQRAGVTHVSLVSEVGDFASFTNVAEQQRFRPRYGLPDEALIAVSYGSQRPNYANIDGAIAITESRLGEERTPGTVASSGTARCNAILKGRGLPDAYEEQTVAGNACSQLWMFEAAVEHAPSVEATSLAAGLQRTRSLELSFPQGPNDFSGNRTTTGGQFWRPTQFLASCNCWQVIDRNFRPSYR
jgi:hypothetical protein